MINLVAISKNDNLGDYAVLQWFWIFSCEFELTEISTNIPTWPFFFCIVSDKFCMYIFSPSINTISNSIGDGIPNRSQVINHRERASFVFTFWDSLPGIKGEYFMCNDKCRPSARSTEFIWWGPKCVENYWLQHVCSEETFIRLLLYNAIICNMNQHHLLAYLTLR